MEEEFEDAEEQSEDNEFEDGRQHYSQIPISERENDDETDNIDRENDEVETDKEEKKLKKVLKTLQSPKKGNFHNF